MKLVSVDDTREDAVSFAVNRFAHTEADRALARSIAKHFQSMNLIDFHLHVVEIDEQLFLVVLRIDDRGVGAGLVLDLDNLDEIKLALALA